MHNITGTLSILHNVVIVHSLVLLLLPVGYLLQNELSETLILQGNQIAL